MTSKTPAVSKPPRRTQESRSAETRAKLLAAAIQSLHARGYAATTTMVVAEDAGVSRGAMLHQFPTKVDLMLFVVETVYQQELVLYREMLGAIEDPRERLLSLPEVAWEVLSRPEGVAVLEVLQGARSDEELARRLKPLQIAIEKDSFQAVDRVAEAAGIPVPPVVKRLMVWSVRGLSIAELLAEEPGEMDQVRQAAAAPAGAWNRDGRRRPPCGGRGLSRARPRQDKGDDFVKLLGLLMASTLLTAPAGLAAAAKANGAAAVAATSQGDRPWMNTALSPDERARLAVEAMTLDEQISLMRTQIGFGLLSLGIPLPDSVPETMRKHTPEGALGSAGFIPAVPRLDLPAIQMTDASLGVGNLGGFLRRGDEATALPSSLALAGSFNTDLARQAGRVVGAEAHAKGFNVQLAGGVNLTREPRNGRNFEYAGEDPLLAGLIIGETIAGIQDEHVVSTSKHYALNSQETGRFVYDARIDEGALRESDLLAFEIAHDRGQPGAVMCAYNRINGVYGCESPFLLKQVLKTEWKYPGWVMSDWGAVHSLTPALDAGLDQESPQDNPHFTTLKAEVEAGRVPASRVAESARRILRSLFAVGAVDSPAAPGGGDRQGRPRRRRRADRAAGHGAAEERRRRPASGRDGQKDRRHRRFRRPRRDRRRRGLVSSHAVWRQFPRHARP